MKGVFLLLFSVAVSCTGRGLVCPENVPIRIGSEIIQEESILPFGHFFTVNQDAEYLFIHYDSSSLCSPCVLKQYYLWDDLMDRLGREKITYCFVLEPRQDLSKEELSDAVGSAYFSLPVYVDRDKFCRDSIGLQTRSGSMDILTDQNGVVLIVGDLRNDVRDFSRILRKIRSKSSNIFNKHLKRD